MRRTLAGGILSILALAVVLCPVLPVRPLAADAPPTSEAVLPEGRGDTHVSVADFTVPHPAWGNAEAHSRPARAPSEPDSVPPELPDRINVILNPDLNGPGFWDFRGVPSTYEPSESYDPGTGSAELAYQSLEGAEGGWTAQQSLLLVDDTILDMSFRWRSIGEVVCTNQISVTLRRGAEIIDQWSVGENVPVETWQAFAASTDSVTPGDLDLIFELDGTSCAYYVDAVILLADTDAYGGPLLPL